MSSLASLVASSILKTGDENMRLLRPPVCLQLVKEVVQFGPSKDPLIAWVSEAGRRLAAGQRITELVTS